MKADWNRWMARFDALAPRERGLLWCAVLGGCAMLVWSLFIDPAVSVRRVATQAIATQQVQLSLLQAQMAALQAPGRSPEAQAKAELDVLKKQQAEMSERLSATESAMVPPQRMAGLLESMIGGRSGLRLVSLRTLPVAPVLERKDGEAAKGEKGKADSSAGNASENSGGSGGLYKHGVELTLEGSYGELTEYLARLEQMPQKLLWSRVALSAEKHPKLVMTLTVFTLSLDRTWLAF